MAEESIDEIVRRAIMQISSDPTPGPPDVAQQRSDAAFAGNLPFHVSQEQNVGGSGVTDLMHTMGQRDAFNAMNAGAPPQARDNTRALLQSFMNLINSQPAEVQAQLLGKYGRY